MTRAETGAMDAGLVRYVGLTERDLELLRAAAPRLVPHLAEMADRFYESLLAHPEAMRAFDSPAMVERLKGTLRAWAEELLTLPRDDAYAAKRRAIGRIHVEREIPQRFVVGAMGLVRDFFRRKAEEAGLDGGETADAIGRACDLDLALITTSYEREIRLKDLRAAMEREIEREKMAALGTLAAGLAHEVGNPLSSISAICQLVEKKGPDDRILERVRTIREAVDRIDAIVRRVLGFARARPEDEEAARPVDLAAAVGEVLDLVGLDRRLKGAEVVRDVPDGLRVVAPRAGLAQVLLNLVLNAAEASEGRGRIAVAARRIGDDVEIAVDDDGPGFSDEALRRATEPFFTTRPDGTGLGLAISYGIVARAGGTLRLENRPAGGARVVVRLSAAEGRG